MFSSTKIRDRAEHADLLVQEQHIHPGALLVAGPKEQSDSQRPMDTSEPLDQVYCQNQISWQLRMCVCMEHACLSVSGLILAAVDRCIPRLISSREFK